MFPQYVSTGMQDTEGVVRTTRETYHHQDLNRVCTFDYYDSNPTATVGI